VADEKELRELEERIDKLKLHEQLYLFERILTKYRRTREEVLAENLRQDAALRERERQRAVGDVTGANREAG
jgi:hypothetical protein